MKRFIKEILPEQLVRWHQFRQIALSTPGLSRSRLTSLYESTRAKIGEERLRAIEANSLVAKLQNGTVTSTKYMDIPYWLRVNIARAIRTNLGEAESKHILDLGCGTGLFVATCRSMGHNAYGIDLPLEDMNEEDRRVYGHCCASLGVEDHLIRRSIDGELSLPEFPLHRSFDIITGFMIRFYCEGGKYWGVNEWKRFLAAVEKRLKPGGHCHFEFNAEPSVFPTTLYVDAETTDLFRSLGQFADGRFVRCRAAS